MRELVTEDLGRALPAPAHRATRTTFGSWRLEALIAHGGCGSVFRGRHVVLDRLAAIKVLHPALADDPAMVARFVQEAQAVNRIRHPNIVDVLDVGSVAGQPYLVMELLDERNLEQRLDADGRLPLPECLAILTPLCHALAAAHAAGFVHRDVKARNVGFTADATAALKLLDFGIAKLLAPEAERGASATMRVGTPHCVAPEQIRGLAVDARTDVYALGVLLFHLATGVYPFDADDSSEVERMHLDAPPPRPSALVPGLAVIDPLVAAAMAKARDARPPSAGAFLAALTTALAPPAAARRAFHRRAPMRRGPAAGRWSVR
ncbi:MAG: serine/threonine protein kinase [Myxococcales bacterium]|nr:serine/threonine protein kinase [Myxococcales bacterium]